MDKPILFEKIYLKMLMYLTLSNNIIVYKQEIKYGDGNG